jgi:predicted short-subunit dehydrogenase-like oxidoreductase (DUF2520 family)
VLQKAKETISVIGAGRLGGALAIALARCGYRIQNLASRRIENAARIAEFIEPKPAVLTADDLTKLSPSEIVLIAAPDPEIGKIAALFAESYLFQSETIFLHTSGSLGSEVLSELKKRGAAVGSLHPLVSVSDAMSGAEKFGGVYFCIEGDAAAAAFAEKAVNDLGGNAFTLATEFKPLYHAAAVMAAGHLTALFDAAATALALCGLEKPDAQRILQPLAASAVENLKTQTPEAALTGTFARADLQTMRRHLAVLSAEKEVLKIYRALGMRSIELARKQAVVSAETLEKMSRELSPENS